MADRRQEREEALSLIFETEFHSDDSKESIYEYALESRELNDGDYTRELFYTWFENKDAVDEKIEKFARGWTVRRLSKVALAVMRLSITEMLFRTDIPFRVSINEAVELVKSLDHDVAPKFVNGILNAVAEEAGLKKNA